MTDIRQNASSSNSSLYSKTTLFIRRIPYDATNNELEEFFSKLGPLRSCFLVKDKEPNSALINNSNNDNFSISNEKLISTKEIIHSVKDTERYLQKEEKNKGFGFVQFVLPEDAGKALNELKKVKFRGKSTLKMEYAIKKHEKLPEPIQKAVKRKFSLQDDDINEKKVKKQSIEKSSDRTIVLQGLPKNLNRKKIYKKVRKFGDVQDLIFPNGESSNDIVHVIFKSTKDANDALSHLDGHIFHGSTMSAKLLNLSSKDKKGRLIVRNIPWQYREQELLKVFTKYGEVIEVNLPRKFVGGPLRGFAYIQYKNFECAEKAIDELNETKHHGRTIALDWALPKDKYLKAVKSQQIESHCDEIIRQEQDSEEEVDDQEDDDHISSDDKIEQDDDEQWTNCITNKSDNELIESENEQNEEEQEADDSMNIDIESESHNYNDNEEDEEGIKSDITGIYDKTQKNMYSPSGGSVLFIRNLSFDATEEELSNIFKPFGPLRYCVITMDHQTGRSRGTGFVRFKQKEHAETCLTEARKVNQEIFNGQETNNKLKKRKELIFKSILTADPSDSLASKFTLHGRVLSIVKAVDRNEAHKLTEMNQQRKHKEDKRNIYLIQEGVIFPDTPAAKLLTPSEVNKRVTSYSMRKNLLAKNLNLYISKTRLSIRNLPLTADESKLKILGKESIKKFKEDVKNGERKDLTESEKMEGWNRKIVIKQAKIVRAKDRIDITTQKPRSKGYGFLEFTQHAHALSALRYLNNNPELFGEKKRLIVEFAVENSIIVKKRLSNNSEKNKYKGQKEARKDNTSIDKKRKMSKGRGSKRRPKK